MKTNALLLSGLLIAVGCAARPMTMRVNGQPHHGIHQTWMDAQITQGPKGPQLVMLAQRSGTIVLYQPKEGGSHQQLVCAGPDLHVQIGGSYYHRTGLVAFAGADWANAAGLVQDSTVELAIPVNPAKAAPGHGVIAQAGCAQ